MKIKFKNYVWTWVKSITTSIRHFVNSTVTNKTI